MEYHDANDLWIMPSCICQTWWGITVVEWRTCNDSKDFSIKCCHYFSSWAAPYWGQSPLNWLPKTLDSRKRMSAIFAFSHFSQTYLTGSWRGRKEQGGEGELGPGQVGRCWQWMVPLDVWYMSDHTCLFINIITVTGWTWYALLYWSAVNTFTFTKAMFLHDVTQSEYWYVDPAIFSLQSFHWPSGKRGNCWPLCWKQ